MIDPTLSVKMYSCGSTSRLMLDNSENVQLCGVEPPVGVTMNLGALSGAPAGAGIFLFPFSERSFFEAAALGELGQPEDDEFRGFHRSDPDVHGEDADVPVLRRVVLLVTFDEERLLRAGPEQCPAAPHAPQEH